MSIAERRHQDVETSLGGLSLSKSSHSKSSHKVRKPTPNQKTSTIADSWEEEAPSGSESESDVQPNVNGLPNAPPPTPISPTSSTARGEWGQFENPYAPATNNDSPLSPGRPSSRPEKQTAVAGRLIAGALGVRAPKKTEEQRQYEKAMKEKEIRRREKERDSKRKEEEDAQKAKAAVWDA